jgi:hypothetical protein
VDEINAETRDFKPLEFDSLEFEAAAIAALWRSIVDPDRRCDAQAS